LLPSGILIHPGGACQRAGVFLFRHRSSASLVERIFADSRDSAQARASPQM
jgi:hypothetical protein